MKMRRIYRQYVDEKKVEEISREEALRTMEENEYFKKGAVDKFISNPHPEDIVTRTPWAFFTFSNKERESL